MIKDNKKVISLALQGGGAHGAFTWGVLDAFLADGRFLIEGISGTSAGAMNALALTQGFIQGGAEGARQCLKDFWMSVADLSEQLGSAKPSILDTISGSYTLRNSVHHRMMGYMQSFLSPYQFNPGNMNPFGDFLKNFFDFELIKNNARNKIFFSATHVMSGRIKIFRLKDLCLEVMLASSCLPFLYQAVMVDDEYYWDGGFVANPAIFPCLQECRTTDCVVIQLTKFHKERLPKTAEDIIDRHKEITYNGCLMREMRAISFITKLIDNGIIPKDRMKRVYMHLIRNENVFSTLDLFSAMNSDRDFLLYLYRRGYATGKEWIAYHYDAVGYRSTVNLDEEFVGQS